MESNQAALSKVEKQELFFYLQEYRPSSDTSKPRFFKKDENQRWRAFHYADKSLVLNADPIIQGRLVKGNHNVNYFHRTIGADIWGTIGKHFGFQLYAADISLNGHGADTGSIPN
ncbi:hypothetical protein ACNPMO_15130, partial [Enterococcus faecium]|uniref:hypothetical protein n=1 Tax=Enterococcus faecium TaxID=1352 RepID=UPI003AAF0A45